MKCTRDKNYKKRIIIRCSMIIKLKTIVKMKEKTIVVEM